MKYKLIKRDIPADTYYYGGNNIHTTIWWALCAAPKITGEIKQLTPFIFCRESLTCRVFDRMSQNNTLSFMNRKEAGRMPIDKLRLLIKTASQARSPSAVSREDKKLKVGVKTALKILNIIERKHKWALTVAYPVEPYSSTDYVHMFVASKKWMRSPHLLSLFTLLVRLAQHKELSSDPSFRRIKTYESLLDRLKKYANAAGGNNDKVTVKQTIKYWDLLFRNYQKLYCDMPMKRNFDQNKYTDHYDEGIQKLCRGLTSDAAMRLRFQAIIEGA